MRSLLPALALIAIVGLGLELLGTSAGHRAVRTAGLSAPPAAFTSVELVDGPVPGRSIRAGSVVPVRVRVTNHGDGAVTYRLESRVTAPGRPVVEGAPQEMTLGGGAGREASAQLRLPRCAGRMRVDLTLAGRAEAVRVWVVARAGEGDDPRKVPACG